jgi:hypothetical protein
MDDTLQVIVRSTVRFTLGPDNKNLRISTDAGKSGNGSGKSVVMSMKDIAAIAFDPSDLSLPDFTPDDPSDLLLPDFSTKYARWPTNVFPSLKEDYGHGCGQSSRI